MPDPISGILLSQLSQFVAAQMGLHFPVERWPDLQRGIRAAAPELGFTDVESCIDWLTSTHVSRPQIEILASHLTVGETYFWRDPKSFAALEERVLPALIRSRRGADQRLRIWSAGCCSGEEPYSIAISLRRTLPDIKDWQITVLGTDINPRFLQKAAEGVFGRWSFRDAPPWLIEGYFKATRDGRYEILPAIKKMVTFSYLNLAEDMFPSLLNNTNAMDVIFCRNVLMYLTAEQASDIVQNFHRSLVADGWLFVNPSETSPLLASRFVTADFPGATVYKKESEARRRPPPPEPLPAPVSVAPIPVKPARPKVEAPPLTATPSRESFTYQEALALYEQGRYAEVTEKLRTPSPHDKRNAPALALLARAQANQGRLPEAREWCDKAIAADKMNPGYHYLRATILQEQVALTEAASSLRQAVYLDHGFVLAHFALGNLAQQQHRFKEAQRHFVNALDLLRRHDPDDLLPESEGITAGRLAEIVASMIEAEP